MSETWMYFLFIIIWFSSFILGAVFGIILLWANDIGSFEDLKKWLEDNE